MSASQTLLVFEQNPEDTSFYLVDHESKQALAARLIAGKMIGEDELTTQQTKAFSALSEWFASPKGKEAKADRHIKGVNIKEVIHFGTYL